MLINTNLTSIACIYKLIIVISATYVYIYVCVCTTCHIITKPYIVVIITHYTIKKLQKTIMEMYVRGIYRIPIWFGFGFGFGFGNYDLES